MHSSEEETDDEENVKHAQFHFWNDWKPLSAARTIEPDPLGSTSTVRVPAKQFKNWIPPVDFGSHKIKRNVGQVSMCLENISFPDERVRVEEPFQIELPHSCDELNDWGSRIKYGTSYEDIDEDCLVWNIFHVSIFGNMKLSINKYGNVVAYADAEISNGFREEKAFLIINKEVFLRKLLGVSSEQWASLLEALGKSQWSLKYEALNNAPAKNLRTMEKLWDILCKRRHLLPCLSIRMRRTGVQKMSKVLKMFPKFTVEDIRTFDGKEVMEH